MTRHASKEWGYRLLLDSAEQEVVAARLAVSQHRHGAAARLKAAERYRDAITRKLDDGTRPASAPEFTNDTLAPDFGVDDEEATR